MGNAALKFGIVSLLAVSLTGCGIARSGYTPAEQEASAHMTPSRFQPATREMRDNIETQDAFTQAAFWSKEYQLNPSDLEAILKLSSSVRKMGNAQRALEITQTSRALYPQNPYLTAEYAASLVALERGEEAIKALDSGLRQAPGYARLWSLKGAALDQMEKYDAARQHYTRALQITPYDPNIMTNMGLSYALAGDPRTAEMWLQRAASQPGAGEGVQRNLALVQQLQGKPVTANVPSNVSSMGNLAASNAVSQNYRPQQFTPQSAGASPWSTPQARQTSPAPTLKGAQSPGYSAPNNVSQPVSQTTPGFRSSFTYSGQQAQGQTASDAARAAARQSQSNGQRTRIPMNVQGTATQGIYGEGIPKQMTSAQSQLQPKDTNILGKIANSIGPKRTMPSNPSYQGGNPYAATGQARQLTPQQYQAYQEYQARQRQIQQAQIQQGQTQQHAQAQNQYPGQYQAQQRAYGNAYPGYANENQEDYAPYGLRGAARRR